MANRRCHHKTVPCRRDSRRIQVRCTGCGKRWWKNAHECPSCGELLRQHQEARIAWAARYMAADAEEREGMGDPPEYTPGCEACYLGLILTAPPQCCCLNPETVLKCVNCLRVGNPYTTHTCLVETEEEIDHRLAMALLPPPRKTRVSEETKAKAAAMDQSQGHRATKYD